MRYRATLQILDDQGNDCGSLVSNVESSVSAAVKEVVKRHNDALSERRERSTDVHADARSLDRRVR